LNNLFTMLCLNNLQSPNYMNSSFLIQQSFEREREIFEMLRVVVSAWMYAYARICEEQTDRN